MADSQENRMERHRRDNPKRKRQEMYCYDTGDDKLQQQQQSSEKSDVIEQQDDQDDSFAYGLAKIRKNQLKKRKMRMKQRQEQGIYRGRGRRKNINKMIEQGQIKIDLRKSIFKKFRKNNKNNNINNNNTNRQNQQQVNIPQCYVQYVAQQIPKNKQQLQLKIFNPQLYSHNIQSKNQLEKQLQQLYQKYGKKLPKAQQPQFNSISWKYLLKQIQQAGKDFAAQRQQRYKLKRKLAKFSQNTWNRMQQINQQKIKQDQKKIRKQSLQLMRHVKRQFWGSGMKVRKLIYQQQKKKMQKQQQMKKLEDLVAKQFQASQKITKILQGYQQVQLKNIQVSQTTNIPVILNIRTKPKFQYIGLHDDNVLRPSILIKFPLREYQLLGVYWISTLHNRGMNAILADEMGLGKTIQTIAFLAHLAIEKGIWGPHLVIVPTTILMNWQIQFKRWCPAFKIMTYFGSPKQRKLKRKGWSKLNSFHVCITSYKIAVTDNPIFRRKKWYYMILDQAQNIKNFKSQRWQILLNFKTKNRLLLTGTPLQNDLTQLWSLLHFLMPRIFNSFQDFNQWFNIPFQQAMQKNFPISQQILKKLHTILRPFFLRRLKKDVQKQLPTKSQRIIRCGMSRRQKYLYDQMIWHQNKKQKNHQSTGMMNVLMGLKKICNHPDLFQPRIQQSPLNWIPLTIIIAHHMFLKSSIQNNKIHILKDFVFNFNTSFQQIAQDILKNYNQSIINNDNIQYYKNKFMDRLFFAKINYQRSKRKQFKVYQFQFQKFQIIQQKIPYYMNKNIIERANQFQKIFDKFLFVVPKVMARPAYLTTFPMNSQVQSQINRLQYLRTKVKSIIPRQLQCIRSRFLLYFPSKTIILYDSGKLVKLIFLLKSIKYRGRKALIFTQMTKMLDIFEKVLNMFKFNYVRLDGSTKTQLRQTIVQRFNNDPRVLCFISSTRSGGIGLNLTGASNVIFYDTDWNPAMDRQAQDRCHRIGQTRDVIIYRLITQYSIQENILMKSIQKRRLQQLVTQQGMFNTSYFQKVNLKDMLAGAIDYNQDDQADLAQVQDQQDRQMLQIAQRQNKQKKDQQQQQLDIQMLPKLFRYGLNMLANSQFDHAIRTQLSDQDQQQQQIQQEDQQIQQEISDENNNQKNNNKKIQNKINQQQKKQQQIFQQVEQQIIQSQSSQSRQKPQIQHLNSYQRLKAVALYQAEYQYMKSHYFYSDNLPIGAQHEHERGEQNKQTLSTKERNQKKRRRRRK